MNKRSGSAPAQKESPDILKGFRCTRQEERVINTLLEDIEDDVGIKTSLQDIARFGIASIIEDYYKSQDKESSVLVKLLRSKRIS